MLDEYLRFWREFDPEQLPFVHPSDRPVLLKDAAFSKFLDGDLESLERLESMPAGKESNLISKKLHLQLLPAPHTGDLSKAKVVVVMINPGTGPQDYADQGNPNFRMHLVRNIRQEFAGATHPLLSLDPAFSHTGGFSYWTGGKMLKGIIALLSERQGRDRALKLLAETVATLEIVPYKSKRFHSSPDWKKLPSVQMAYRVVNEYLKPRAAEGQVDVIIMRGVRALGFQYDTKLPGFDIYPRNLAQGGTLGPTSTGGALIKARLGL